MTLGKDAVRGRLGFTLIELLVVVAIIALLISILLPALHGAREQAKQLLCNTNMRSQGQAAQHYADEWDDWLVRHNDDDARMHFAAAFIKYLEWDGRVYQLWDRRRPFILANECGKIPAFQCPKHPNPEQNLDYVVNGFPFPYTLRHARMDIAGGGRAGDRYRSQRGGHWVNFFKRSNFGNLTPARIIYTVEGHHSLLTTELRYHDLFYTSQLPWGAWPRISNDKRHPGGINAMFFDGHAVTMGFTQIDAGWPNSIGLRLKWFAPTVPELF